MKTYLSLAPAPIEEDCAQVGTPGYREQALAECARFIRLLRQKFGPEPEGAWLSVKWFDHDFGPVLRSRLLLQHRYPAICRVRLHLRSQPACHLG